MGDSQRVERVLTGVGPDELVQRDNARQEHQQRLQGCRRLWMRVGAGLALVASSVIAWLSFQNQKFRAEVSERGNREAFHAAATGAFRRALELALVAHTDSPKRCEPASMIWFLFAWGEGDREELPDWSGPAGLAPGLIAASPDDRLLAAVSQAAVLSLHDWKANKQVGGSFQLPAQARHLTFRPDSQFLAISLTDGELLIAAIQDTGIAQPVVIPDNRRSEVQLGWREGELVTLDAGLGLHRYDCTTGRHLSAVAPPPPGTRFITLSGDASHYLAQVPARELQIRTVVDDGIIATIPWPEIEPIKARFSPDGRSVILVPGESPPRIWSWLTTPSLRLFDLHSPGTVEFFPQPEMPGFLVTCGDGHFDQFVDLESGKRLALQSRSICGERSLLVRLPRSGRYLLWGDDARIYLFSKPVTPQTWPTVQLDKVVKGICLHPDGMELAVLFDDGSMQRFQMPSLKPVGEPLHSSAAVTSLAYSDDGSQLIYRQQTTDSATGFATAVLPLIPLPANSFRPFPADGSGNGFSMEFYPGTPAHAFDYTSGEPTSPPVFAGKKLQAGADSTSLALIAGVDAQGLLSWRQMPAISRPGPWVVPMIEAATGISTGVTTKGYKVSQPLMLHERMECCQRLSKWLDGDESNYGPRLDERSEWARLFRWLLTPPTQRTAYP